ncbi:FtsX-like permease family protein [Bifidobacterium oedipodis]|uniref:LigH n=1 Tax=Bifidobacterium oedipodis TaxID=2675322 RepID=A0A7Y0EQZ6_9BIFI|nr:FtsX-like permease family protein [Bifidobacterium sp. DSM 109957]NMM94363.1 LigH [Bifidobacterium sp. DSM 109957]
MMRLAWEQIKHAPGRLAAVLIAVVLSAAMLAGTVVFSATSNASMAASTAAPLKPADLVIDANGKDSGGLDSDWADQILDDSGIREQVAATSPYLAATFTAYGQQARGSASVYSISSEPTLRWFGLKQGRWPTGNGEVVISQDTADQLGIRSGDTITLKATDGMTRTVAVVGINDVTFKPLTGTDYALYADPAFFGDTVPGDLLVKLKDPNQATALLPRLAHSAEAQGFAAFTGADMTRQAAAMLAGGSTQLTVIMAVFALIATLCAMMVISGTYRTLIAQRARDIAMLRLVGARRSAVRAMVLAEALFTGIIGAVIGGVLGAGGAYAAMVATGQAYGGFAANPALLVGALALAVASTVIAAWTSVRHATRIPPIRALDAAASETSKVSDDGRLEHRRAMLCAAIGLVLAVLGVALLWLGADRHAMPLALVGGLALAAGLVLALPVMMAALMPAAGRILTVGGLSGRLAASNLMANARRAGSTITAVAFGVTLIAALASAAATGQATIMSDNEHRYPISAALATPDGTTLSDKVLRRTGEVTDAAGTYPVRTATIDHAPDGGKATPQVLEVIPDQAASVFAADDDWHPARDGADSAMPVALVHPRYMKAIGAAAGEQIDLEVAGMPFTVVAQPSQLTESPRLAVIITDAQLAALPQGEQLTSQLVTSQVWFKARLGTSRAQLAAQVNRLAVADPEATVSGGIAESADILNVLNLLLTLSYAMLAVTVLISLAGLTNQLALAITERSREISMLRALGTRRSVIRGSIAWEALVQTVFGTAVGLVVGLPLGVAGVKAQIGGMTRWFAVSLPWAQVAVLAVVLIVAGLIASVIPARHATRIQPAQGLTS